MVADVVPISESSSSQFLADVRTNSSAGSTLMLSGKKNTVSGVIQQYVLLVYCFVCFYVCIHIDYIHTYIYIYLLIYI